MNVICYYESNGNMFSTQSEQLIDLWKKSWRDNGFTPVVLGVDDAKQHVSYDELDLENNNSLLYKIPLNRNRNLNYIRSAYRRLVAYSNYVLSRDTTLYADYDVINYNFTVEDYHDIEDGATIGTGHSSVKLNYEKANLFIEYLYKIQKGKIPPQESDMHMHSLLEGCMNVSCYRRSYEDQYCGTMHRGRNEVRNESYMTSKLVHYDGGLYRFHPELAGLSRYDVIQKVRPIHLK